MTQEKNKTKIGPKEDEADDKNAAELPEGGGEEEEEEEEEEEVEEEEEEEEEEEDEEEEKPVNTPEVLTDDEGTPGGQEDGEDCVRDDADQTTSVFIPIVERYEGNMLQEQFHGEGVAHMEGGHTYEGTFSRGLMEGTGVFTHANGLKYEGEFRCNTPMGRGTYTWPNGSTYVGKVYHGLRHEAGTHVCAANGVSYTGQWNRGKRHGKGMLYYNQEKTSWYDGEWVQNRKEGWGVRCYPSGNVYSGEWKNNLRHGEGTMRWLNLGQQYVGMWQNGVQHGRGTHVWILRQVEESQCFLSNQYTGDFVQGQRHGRGTFYHASGAFYEGEWCNNKSVSKGRWTSIYGHVREDIMFEQIMTQDLYGNKSLIPLFDMALSIEGLLDAIPERERDAERKQVEFTVWTHYTELRSIYRFYSRLGFMDSRLNLSLMTRLQLWCLLKDCYVHHHGIPLTQIDCFMADEANPAEVHSPFSPILLRRFLYCLVVVAYNVFRKRIKSQSNILAACLSKLITENILPNAKNVKGVLFRRPEYTAEALNYLERCWDIYQAHCKVNPPPRDDKSMTCRELLWLFKDLNLLDHNLTTARVMEIITADRLDPQNFSSCLDVEIAFLEFFEILLGCAEVKCPHVSREMKECQTPSSRATSEDSSSLTDSRLPSPEESINAAVELPAAQQEATGKSETAEQTEEPSESGKEMRSSETKARSPEMELQILRIHQFFNKVFFPAVERKLMSQYVKK